MSNESDFVEKDGLLAVNSLDQVVDSSLDHLVEVDMEENDVVTDIVDKDAELAAGVQLVVEEITWEMK